MSAEAVAAWCGVAVTLVLSIASLAIAHRVDRRSSADHERDVQRDLERQAARVSAWVAFRFRRGTDGTDIPHGNHLVLLNASSEAIYDVRVDATMKGRSFVFTSSICPPGRYTAEWQGHRPEGFDWGFLSDAREIEASGDLLRPFTVSPNWRVTTFEFVDSTGLRWSRVESEGIRQLLG
ncbi:hypothetical protein ITJ64_01580 [Herbiconiux sp. VKM Ac-1786]|uniref:hypothetical protein n=1 Tax=Herbiconiux sp. VKM Ac-1786 TaxID=2783824 RepID=UPI00188D8A00|nr:hypothetical protein [Herbiconiux sp. VKM Ac-1786]MBF4571201.1 hypothetical protein [Herbiconiux sp. VKM Ac-1786]